MVTPLDRAVGVFYWLGVVAVLVMFVWLTLFKPTPQAFRPTPQAPVEPLPSPGAAKPAPGMSEARVRAIFREEFRKAFQVVKIPGPKFERLPEVRP